MAGTKTLESTRLAIEGGPRAKTTPYGAGKRFGKEELAQLREALEQNTLFYFKGKKVRAFTEKFASMIGAPHCVATSSGTAAIHVALSTLGVGVGDEVITSPLTDMGTVIGILFQNAIPIFADVEPHTYNLDPGAVERAVTPRTKAIVAVHLAGNPCDMDALLFLSQKYSVPIIEDCAQAFGTLYRGRKAGTLGVLGCFSTNDFKHISTGDGGLIVTAHKALAGRAFEITDKNYYRQGEHAGKSPRFLAPNYRMTELQGAVGLAQLDRLGTVCRRRNELGDRLSLLISGTEGVQPHEITPGGVCTYFNYMARIETGRFKGGLDGFIGALNAEGVPAWRHYPKTLYEADLFANRTIYHESPFPLEGTGRSYSYPKGLCPAAEEVTRTSFSLPVSEFFTNRDIEETAQAVRKVAQALLR